MDLECRLKKILCEQMCIHERLVGPDTLFIEDLAVDSIDAIELATAVENEFGIEIPDEALEGFRTVANALAYIRARASMAEMDA